MKDLYRRPEAELLKFAPSETVATDWFSQPLDDDESDGV